MLLRLGFGGDEVGAYPDGNVVTGGGERVMTMREGEVAGWVNVVGTSCGWGSRVGGGRNVAVGRAGKVGMVEGVETESGTLGRCGS